MRIRIRLIGWFFVILCLSIALDCLAKTPYEIEIDKNDCPKEGLIIASLSGKDFGGAKSDEEIEFIAEFLRDADIVLIQEVVTAPIGSQTVGKLALALNWTGAKWDYAVSDPTHPSDDREKFGFIWKTMRIKAMPQKPSLLIELSGLLVREPAKLNLVIDGGKRLTVVNFHLAPTAKHPKMEIKAIGGHPELFTEPNLILAGDFNLGHKALDPVFEGILNLKHNIEGKTSIGNKVGKDGTYFSREYDNIYTSAGITVCKAAIVDFIPYFGDIKKTKYISDHMLVYIVFTLK